ncbi:outer arm dynein light chain 1 [Thozetella sp. PMI_491]|nr:outer arm dynein light chain 1 [Thozetella sp. PMI_491]
MHDLDVLRDGGYLNQNLTKFKLTCPLDSFPDEIRHLGETLEQLDLSGTGLSSLPAELGTNLPKLKVAFFSNCNFKVFPKELASCPQLEMVAFRSNGMEEIPENSLPPRLRWLILTDNQLSALPASIGQCPRLQKCMLAGNRLQALPSEMAQCKKLGLLRLSANQLESLPPWLFELPELAFLSFAGNPCSRPGANGETARSAPGLANVSWGDLRIEHTLGSGASGIISKGTWQQSPTYSEEVAVKLFRGALTSDGTPADEMAACLAAGSHESLIDILGRIHDHPDEEAASENKFQGGIVMQLIPPYYAVLGQPPSLTSCTRDCYAEDAVLDGARAVAILRGIASAAEHLHSRGIAHGDIYAHNILVSGEDGHALLGDFGAATVYGQGTARNCAIERLEVLAFAHLTEDILGLVKEESVDFRNGLEDLHRRCVSGESGARPTFTEIVEELQGMVGWRAMMRLPN